MRKAQTSAIPKAWIKSYKEVLGTPSKVAELKSFEDLIDELDD
jgi:hypothetical protein